MGVAVFFAACSDDDSSPTSTDEDIALSSDSQDSTAADSTSSKDSLKVSSSSKGDSTSAKSSSSKASKVKFFSCDSIDKPNFDYLNLKLDYQCFTDERDEQVYATIEIGDQVWMAENLNYAAPEYEGKGSYCYDDFDEMCETYGRLYTWAAALDSLNSKCGLNKHCKLEEPIQGLCPKGFHVPTQAEFNILFDGMIGVNIAGNYLKSADMWNKKGGTNDFGFSLIPAGYKNDDDYYSIGEHAYLWTATEEEAKTAQSEFFNVEYNGVYLMVAEKNYGYSLRCIMD